MTSHPPKIAAETAQRFEILSAPAFVLDVALDELRDLAAQHGPIDLGGVVVLANDAPKDCDLVLRTAGGEKPVRWGLDSPWRKQRHPDSANGEKARFRIVGLNLHDILSAQLILRQAGTEYWPLVQFSSQVPKHPYELQSEKAFWKKAVVPHHAFDIDGWYHKKFEISDKKIATAGSCFAQHIGRELRSKGFHYLDVEPPPSFLNPARWPDYGYDIYSARYGNIYTTRQLLQLFQRAFGEFTPIERCWPLRQGYVDPFRPTIEPKPIAHPDDIEQLRSYHLSCVRKLFEESDIFVFTLGLTEAWVSIADDAAFPVAPGVAGGLYDPSRHRFINFSYPDIIGDMTGFFERVHSINSRMKFLLTVSPVPLMATATSQHVVVATTYSKSVLRAVAGELAARLPYVDYFPSYEIITAPVMRGIFFNSDSRSVSQHGVNHVMTQFFKSHPAPRQKAVKKSQNDKLHVGEDPDAVVCDEELLNAFGAQS